MIDRYTEICWDDTYYMISTCTLSYSTECMNFPFLFFDRSFYHKEE